MKRVCICVMVCVLILCSSCSYSVGERDGSAHAILDYENNRIIMPLDQYADFSEVQYYNMAVDILYKRCYEEKGGVYSINPPGVSILGQGREFGLWNPEETKKHGLYQRDNRDGFVDNSGVERKYQKECYEEKVKQQLQDIGDLPFFGATYEMVRGQAISSASLNPEWRKAREKWFGCMREQGLTPRTHNTEWSVLEESGLDTSGSPSEEEIRIATIEAQCSKDTGMAQTLADLVASYQAPLIKKHEVQLQKELDEYKANNEKFKKFVLDNQ